jgi:hypothetical protein
MIAASLHRKRKIEGEEAVEKEYQKITRSSKNELKAKTAVHKPTHSTTN